MEIINKICHKIYTQSFKKIHSLDGVNRCFENICLLHKIKRFSIVQMSQDIRKQFFFCYSSYPSAWVKKYLQDKYYEYDPVLKCIISMPFPFYWEADKFENLSDKEKLLFTAAKDFNITSGTTIPLTPCNNTNSYLTVLDLDLTLKFNSLFWLRAAGNAYLKKREEILKLKNKKNCTGELS